MPFVSKAQQGFMEAHKAQLEKQGVNLKEWEQATDYSKLPKKARKSPYRATYSARKKSGGGSYREVFKSRANASQ